MLFIFALLGDFNYVVSVLLFSVDKVSIIRTLPWLVGSAVSLFFDIFVSTTFILDT